MRRFIVSLVTCIILACSAIFAQAANISIISTYPINGATNVDIAITDILVRFNTTDLDVNSFTGTGPGGHAGRVSVNNGANYTSSLLDDSTGDYIKIHLNSPLSYSTAYTVTINWRVQDIYANNLGTTYTFSFTTMAKPPVDTTPPTIVSTFPLNNATGVPVTAVPSVTFDGIMDSTTINTTNSSSTTNIRLRNQTTGTVVNGGTVTLDASGKVAYFYPPANLSPSTYYRLRITTNVTDLAGNHLQAQYDLYFTTMAVDTTPPAVTVVSPLSGATGVPIGTTISAKFSEAMDSTTITTSTFTVSGGVTGTVSYDAGTFTATFTPSAALANGTNYTATVTTGVTDMAGNHMSVNKSWTFTTVQVGVPPLLNDYAQVPSFLTNSTTAQPNVLLIVDNSGSMYEFAYKKSPDGTCSDYGNNCYDNGYSPSTTYYGYFDSTQMYAYSTTGGGYFQVDTTKALDKNSFWSGNFLNWLTMRRVDVIRKVLVGGKTQPRSANTANYLIPTEDPDRDYYKTYNNVKYTISAGASTEQINDTTHNTTYNLQVYVGNQPPQDGLILNYSGKIRFGIMFFNDGYRFESNQNSVKDGGNLAVDIGATGNDLITQIETTNPSTWTPLAETLYESIRYFEATSSAYNGGTYSGKDPIQYRCQKNFMLILTDGESTMDQNVPGTTFTGGTAVTDPYGFNVQTWMDNIATNEGYASQKSTSANTDKGTYYLEGVAYYAHRTDLRSSTVGNSSKILAGNQNLTIYTVFAFDDSPVGRDLLKKTAKYGGFNDMDNDGVPFTDSTCDPATRGASARNPKCNEWNTAGDGVPDTYYEASDGSALESSLTRAFNSILARVASGTAASILSSSSGTGANILQAMFYPQKFFGDTPVDWIGEMHSLWYYVDPFIFNSSIREDNEYTDTTRQAPHYLDLATDRVIDFSFDTASGSTVVNRFTDARGDGKPDIDTNGDGVLDSYTPYDTNVSPDDLSSIWKAGALLLGRSVNSRAIYTQLDGSLVDFNYQSTGNTLDIGSYLDTTSATVRKYLMAANQTEANKIIDYIRGTDQSGYRPRTVTLNGVTGVWKLGDIITSTPRQQTTYQLNDYDRKETEGGYNDTSYSKFYNQAAYQNRGMVYVGANDGMLHAFKMGKLTEALSVTRKAALSGPNLGDEQWAFIPRNSLPYLRYLTDINYTGFSHLYYVDGTSVIKDVSIGKPTACASADYADCDKDFTNGTNYRTVLVGSMGLGGASSINGSGCKTTSSSSPPNGTCVETPTLDPLDNTKGLGYSSYFALDITNQSYNSDGTLSNKPQLLWEFSDPALGFSMSGAAIVHISAKNADNTPNVNKNGKWFAVLASGPTGPIDTTAHQFYGTSSQPLTLFVLDLATGTKVATINTLVDGSQLTNAFAGAINSSVVDVDRMPNLQQYPGYYSDDALYFGYVQNATSGGVLRLVTNADLNPQNWKLSKVIDGIGPVTRNVPRLRRLSSVSSDLWLYFGTGRYYYNLDDLADRQLIAGLKEPCYRLMGQVYNIDYNCTTKLTLSDLTNQTSGTATVTKGWYIPLAQQDTTNDIGAERSITDPTALISQMVVFTTFAPSSDVCGFGGNSFLWGVKYDTGGAPLSGSLQARAVLQLSTGSIVQSDLTNLTGNGGRSTTLGDNMTGKAPGDETTFLSKAGNRPVKKIIHIQEK